MDVIDNIHFARVVDFVKTEDLEIKLSRNGLRELPWQMGLYRFNAVGVDLLYEALAMTFSEVLKLVSLWVMNQQARGINAVDPVSPVAAAYEDAVDGNKTTWNPGKQAFNPEEDRN